MSPGYYRCNRWPFFFRVIVSPHDGSVNVWGFSIWRKVPGYRTLGIPVDEWARRYKNLNIVADRDRTGDREFVRGYRCAQDQARVEKKP